MTSNIDERVREALRAAADSIEPPVQELVEGGLARGRQLQRRRRLVLVGTGLAAAAVVASGAMMAPHLTAGQQDIAAPGDDTSRSVVEAVPANPGTSADAGAPADVEPISSDEVLEILLDLLPPGEIVDSRSLPQDQLAEMYEPPGAFVTFDDGEGAAGISITLSDFPSGSGCYYSSPKVQCIEEVLDDGSTLWIIQRPTYTDGRQPDLLEWWATLERPDGAQIDLRQNNAVGEKDVPATRSEPPLTIEQMAAIVTSDQWDVFEVHPDRQNEIAKLRDKMSVASRRLADALGSGWTLPETTRVGYRAEVVPTPENVAELPIGYAHVTMARDVIPGRSDVFLDQVCREMTEKGLESGTCDESTTPTAEPVYLRWSHSVDHSQSVPHDELWVMFVNDDEVVRVMLSVSDDPELSTSERRADIVAWIEQQIDAMIAAATAEDATTR